MSTSILDTQSLLTPQQRADQGLIRALGRQILRQLPQADYAFTYGSSAMPQFDYETGKGESVESMLQSIDYHKGSKMFDIVLATENINSWHDQNLKIMFNDTHYSFAGRHMRNITGLTQLTQYHPQIPIVIQDKMLLDMGVPEVVNVKYGVTPLDNLITDCTTWASLYLAGRLHKPVTVLQDNPLMTLARELNLHHAVVFALLQLPPTFTELDLYTTIASISYNGDIRTKFGAEDPEKVKKLIKGSLPFFRELYGGVLTTYLNGASTVKIQPHSTSSNDKIPLYDYLRVPVRLSNGGNGQTQVQLDQKGLPLFKNYHDIYQQINTIPPENVILSQPDTIQHKAMLMASLPANTYLHRTGSLSFMSDEHQQKQEKFDQDIKNSKLSHKDNSANDGSDQAGIKAPGINNRDDNELSQGKGKGTRPLTYFPPTNDIEKEIPVLPACLTAIPYSSLAFSFGPEVLNSIYASISPYVKFDRQKMLTKDSKELHKIIHQNKSKIEGFLEQKKLKQQQQQQQQLLSSKTFLESTKKAQFSTTPHSSSLNTTTTTTTIPTTTHIQRNMSTFQYLNQIEDELMLKQHHHHNHHNTTKQHRKPTQNYKSLHRGQSTTSQSSQHQINNRLFSTQKGKEDEFPYDDDTKTISRGVTIDSTSTEFVDLERVITENDVTSVPTPQGTGKQDDDLLTQQHQQDVKVQQFAKIQKAMGKAVRKLENADDDDDEEDNNGDNVVNDNKQTELPPTTTTATPRTQQPKPAFLKNESAALKRPLANLKTPNPHQPHQSIRPMNQNDDSNNQINLDSASQSTSARFNSNFSSLYTSTVADILAIDQTLETPQQHSAHIISTRLMRQHLLLNKKDHKLIADPTNPTSTLAAVIKKDGFTQSMQSSMDTITLPNPTPSKLVLPVVTPLPLPAAITNTTELKLLNVDTPHNTIVRAIELDLPVQSSSSKGKKQNDNKNNNDIPQMEIPQFIGWNQFNHHSNAEVLKQLPTVPSTPQFTQFQARVRNLRSSMNSEIAKERTQKRLQVMDMKKKIKQLNGEIGNEQKLLGGSTNTNTTTTTIQDNNNNNNATTQLSTIKQKMSEINTLQSAIDGLNTQLAADISKNSPSVTKIQEEIAPSVPGLWSAIRESSALNSLSVVKGKVSGLNQLTLDILSLARLKPSSSALNEGLIIQDPRTLMIEVNSFKNTEYFGSMFDIPEYSRTVKPVGGANYTLNTIPRVDLDGKFNKDQQLIFAAAVGDDSDLKVPVSAIDRSKLQEDPWFYDRKTLPRFEDKHHTSVVELLGQVQAGALPEGGTNIFNDRRQRWQVHSVMDKKEQEDEIRRLGLKISPSTTSQQQNKGQSSQDEQVNNNNLLSAYKTPLDSQFINVSAGKYDPRRHMAGVARFDNAVNALQIIYSTKFPLFGASMLSSRLRQDIMPLWRHDLTNHNNENDNEENKTKKLNNLVGPLTSANAIKTSLTDAEFLSALSHLKSNSSQNNIIQDNSIKGKNFEWMNLVYDWEGVLKGGYSIPNAKHAPHDVVNAIINNRTSSIVYKSSVMQTLAGLLSAGPVKSIKYVWRKLKKGRGSKKPISSTPPSQSSSSSFKPTTPASSLSSRLTSGKRGFSTTTKPTHHMKKKTSHQPKKKNTKMNNKF